MPKNPESQNWAAFTAEAPELSAAVQNRFAAFTHHTLATLRRDGSPRTSGIEVQFARGELTMGMMPESMKARDLIRDPRFALQANQGGGTDMGGGDVRVAGRAVEVHGPEELQRYAAEAGPPPGPFHLFRTEVTEVVRTSIEDERYLVVEFWSPGTGVRRRRRT
ncbi:pyridoxamine 5'-phosphate oxidase family protein [Streptomyces uncialis]|uniref:Pyridoxamine 5'-phosphate oxidase n=1 Tax=Streptomyces uncialis TaxID=1048205 RepID=A0A1Q4V1X8_9ACTN|nr:pyridoxamine 5'-phosphate oxidase family protein [Streptomyces uncialis]OKH91816.1 pyridoxamine 5'-phosphate oxidase [Streptomyces uncialis]